MVRVLYAPLLTEAGLDLLTEAGEPLSSEIIIGLAGEATVDGGVVSALQSEAGLDLLTESGIVLALARRNGGTVTGTGRVTAPIAESLVHGPRFIRLRKPLRGVITATGTPGRLAGRGHLTLVGQATLQQPLGAVTGHGQITLSGAAHLTAPPAQAQARGDTFDELALILALAA